MAAAASSDFPLQCIVCPKKPTFSDVSHLLTHVASKGHLSQYYKLKIRSSHDVGAMDNLQTFDLWYANNNIEQLMSERMHLKERKRPRLRTLTSKGVRLRTSVERHQPSYQTSDETKFLPATRVASASASSHIASLTSRSYRPRLYLWPTTRPKSFGVQCLESSSPSPEHSWSSYPTAPVARMWVDEPTPSTLEDDLTDSLRGEMTKLKGVLWPGMDIFDAATPDMKRKRNQKKDTSVAVQLERQSLLAEPTEMIFTPFGSWRKSRVISGQPDFNSSPDKLSPPVSKPRRRRSNREPLGTKDANVALRSSNQESPSPSPFPGYNRAKSNLDSNVGPSMKYEGTPESLQASELHQCPLSSGMRYLTASLNLPQHTGPENRSLAPSTLLDISTGALYHNNNFFADALESYHQAFVGLPYYGISYFEQPHHLSSGLFPYCSTYLSDSKQTTETYLNDNESTIDDDTVSAKSEG